MIALDLQRSICVHPPVSLRRVRTHGGEGIPSIVIARCWALPEFYFKCAMALCVIGRLGLG